MSCLSSCVLYWSTWGTLFPRYGLPLVRSCNNAYQLYPSWSRCSYTALHFLAVQISSSQNPRNVYPLLFVGSLMSTSWTLQRGRRWENSDIETRDSTCHFYKETRQYKY